MRKKEQKKKRGTTDEGGTQTSGGRGPKRRGPTDRTREEGWRRVSANQSKEPFPRDWRLVHGLQGKYEDGGIGRRRKSRRRKHNKVCVNHVDKVG